MRICAMAFIIVCGGSYGATERRAGAPRHEHINENKKICDIENLEDGKVIFEIFYFIYETY